MPTKIRSQRQLNYDLSEDSMDACWNAKMWIEARGFTTWKQCWDNCERGDQMIWLLIKLNVKAPYGRHAVIALEQGFKDPDAFMFNAFVGETWQDVHLRDFVNCPDSADRANHIFHAAERKAILHGSYLDEYEILKFCADRIRQVVPWKVVNDALKIWHAEHKNTWSSY